MPDSKMLKPAHRSIKAYYASLQDFMDQHVNHETGVRAAFQRLLEDTARSYKFVVIAELRDKKNGRTIVPDATIKDGNNLPRGHWEAKDTKDNLEVEIAKKIKAGYPLDNIIFEDTKQARLYQAGKLTMKAHLSDPRELCDLLNTFFSHTEPDIDEFEKAIDEFKERVPDLALGLSAKIKLAHAENPVFQNAFDAFFALCQKTLNPNLREEAVDEMLVQHLLTERLIRTIFDNPEFTARNVIANEVEKVIAALVSQSFNRKEFLASLDRFYAAIEAAAARLNDFTEKQHFLNSVYERFFQGYSVKVADTHGIVYTPQPVVDFMCASVAEALKTEFGKTLSDPDVFIIDPCTGTGNFIVNLMRRIPKKHLPDVYKNRLFANEVMLLPYYIASLNIEHAYYELTGNYEAFEGLCFVDTLELAEARQHKLEFMTEKNTERVERQRKSPITVVIGNPPYNIGQLNENDNNKNRRYPVIEKRIQETYSKDSKATNKVALSDAYVKFFRWSIDRLGNRDGIICFISNNSFVDQIAFDGMRRHLLADFTRLYHIDLHGNVRRNPKLSGTTHNIFGIQVGVGITIAIRKVVDCKKSLFYHRVPEESRREEKLLCLTKMASLTGVKWKEIMPSPKCDWISVKNEEPFRSLISLGSKEGKANKDEKNIFHIFSNGVKTNRDSVLYDFDKCNLIKRVKQFVDDYNAEIDHYKRAGGKAVIKNVDDFVKYDNIKWSVDLKDKLQRANYAEYEEIKVRDTLYRPFNKTHLFFDRVLNNSVHLMHKIFPNSGSENNNEAVCLTDMGSAKPFMVMASNHLVDFHLVGAGASTLVFPFYIYNEIGNQVENITDWSLKTFQKHYGDQKISKRGILHFLYGILHHPAYVGKFGDCLRYERPRIPFAPDFRSFAAAGQRLMELHLNYETAEPYPLAEVVSDKLPYSMRVEDKMRLSKNRTQVVVNPSLTLAGVPVEAFEYRLGNRSALEWVLDQYQVKKDERTGVVSDPNKYGPPDYIVKLVGRVIAVSLETVKIVKGLPEDFGA